MKRAHRTPSPAPEAQSSFVKGKSRTPDGMSLAMLGIDPPVNMSGLSSTLLYDADTLTTTSPQTPPPKRGNTDWHGLPSPHTPASFNEIATQRLAAKNESDQGDKLSEEGCNSGRAPRKPTLSPITSRCPSVSGSEEVSSSLESEKAGISASFNGNQKLARNQEASSSPSTRRSARIRNKIASTEEPQLEIVSSKTTSKRTKIAQQQKQDSITIAEPSSSLFDVSIPLMMTGLPVVHSLDWQLQYPSGGSTHPCYPWPTADPRLLFHAHFVPLRNGLPDVSLVPALGLPTGWRQASWSGLHPVVFDPYQQAFKLTPIGPLPLTCEELNQGSLHDYVPGGKLHPEVGLIPTILEFSDGSNLDVFNFDGVDWTLPWADHTNYSTLDPDNFPISHQALLNPLTNASFANVQTPARYLESRDCPDKIIDLEEAWRWLSEHEGTSYSNFTPTPGKTWRGTGVRRTGRRFKAPIASLMASTMAEEDRTNKEGYLLNQDTREFDAFKSVATPVHVNIALLQDVEFTLVELLCYFPSHYQWRKGGDRLVQSGMTASEITNFINMSRCLPGDTTCSRNSVEENVFRNKLEDGTRVRVSQSESEVASYTAEGWTYSVWELTDYPLLALAHGLRELPSGSDAGALTYLIKWCRDRHRFRAMLSDVPLLLEETDISSLIDPGSGQNPDKEVIIKHGEAIRVDRLRVLKEIRISKQMREEQAMMQKVPKKRRVE